MIKDTYIQIRSAIDLVSDTVVCIQNFSEKDWEVVELQEDWKQI